MKGTLIKGMTNGAGGRDKEERVRCSAQPVRHSADSFKFEHKHKMPTDLEKLKPVQPLKL